MPSAAAVTLRRQVRWRWTKGLEGDGEWTVVIALADGRCVVRVAHAWTVATLEAIRVLLNPGRVLIDQSSADHLAVATACLLRHADATWTGVFDLRETPQPRELDDAGSSGVLQHRGR